MSLLNTALKSWKLSGQSTLLPPLDSSIPTQEPIFSLAFSIDAEVLMKVIGSFPKGSGGARSVQFHSISKTLQVHQPATVMHLF